MNKIFVIKDKKLDSYGRIIEARNEQEMIRSFTEMLNNPQHKDNNLVKHSQDFDLYEIGSVNTETAKITALDSPRHHFCLEDLKML